MASAKYIAAFVLSIHMGSVNAVTIPVGIEIGVKYSFLSSGNLLTPDFVSYSLNTASRDGIYRNNKPVVTDLPTHIEASTHCDGHTQQLVDRGLGERWECDCEEYRTPKPNTARAYCAHTEKAVQTLVSC